jgi:hypothetical protein
LTRVKGVKEGVRRILENKGLPVAAFLGICLKASGASRKGAARRSVGELPTFEENERQDEEDNSPSGSGWTPTRRAQRLGREKDGAGRGRVPKWEGMRGWKDKFTHDHTALLINCQVISHVVMIRTAFAWGVS